MKVRLFSLLSLLTTASLAQQQTPRKDSVRTNNLNEVVVTATRTEKLLSQIPVPVTQISSSEIKNRGMVRLNEILAEQTGLTIVTDHGKGIQMQGFSPEYTMIMIDGEPVIGRTSGTLELSRIATTNIDKIEIVKGPSSSLYGSEAMAGVINIITQKQKDGVSSSLSARYGTNNNVDLSIESGFRKNKFDIGGFVNRNSSSGYALRPETGTKTVSPFEAYTFNLRSGYQLTSKSDLKLSVRYFDSEQDDRYFTNDRFASGKGNEKNLSIAPSYRVKFNEKLNSSARLYYSSYKTKSLYNYEDDHTLFDQTFFNQTFTRGELQTDYAVSPGLKVTGGAGAVHETVEASRYEDLQSFNSGYGYVQADWQLLSKLSIIAGGRFDAHSEYKSQFSPKLAASYKLNDRFMILASAGKGYKAPDFRQLYLNFANAVVGYSVFGYIGVADRLKELQNAGLIERVLIDPTTLQSLDAESSTSLNAGFRYAPMPGLSITFNAFRNNIKNLISTQPIALKTNGLFVYSYFNLNSVVTQGAETEVTYSFAKNFEVALGLQYLDAFDQAEKDKIEAGEVYTKDENNRTRLVKMSEYGGLYNRSKWMANARVSYNSIEKGITASIRSIYRGKYGISDIDGNGILNADSEYVKGYNVLNASVSKSFYKNRLRLQVTAENLLNYRDIASVTNLPGRLLYGGISFNFNK
jgi:outer membrane receptor for ferrienterochelin and colicins